MTDLSPLKAHHSLYKVKNLWSYTSNSNKPTWRGAYLKHKVIFVRGFISIPVRLG